MPDHGRIPEFQSLSQALSRLPQESPPHSAWPAIQTALARRGSQRRNLWRTGSWLAVAAAAGFFAIVAYSPTAPEQAFSNDSIEQTITQLQTEANRLQSLIDYAQQDPLVPANDLLVSMDFDKQLTGLDYVLQSTQLNDQDRAALWQQRVRILEDYAAFETRRRALAARGQSLSTALIATY